MLDSFDCPVCGGFNWLVAGYDTFSREEFNQSAQKGSWSATAGSGCLRREVFFDLWFPGSDRVLLHTVCCNVCGFVCYSPRPDEADLTAKYRYLSDRKAVGTLHVASPRSRRLDAQRASLLSKRVTRHRAAPIHDVLDFGGGDGRLMRPFVTAGCRCYLVDYNDAPITGVERLARTLQELPQGFAADLIICSHVLEHLAMPTDILVQLRATLRPRGMMYVEVPLEVWRGIPTRADPVTHINFFTPDSMLTALNRAGFRPRISESGMAPYGERFKRTWWAIATPDDTARCTHSPQATHAKDALFPSGLQFAWRSLQNLWLHGLLNGPLHARRLLSHLRMRDGVSPVGG